MEEEKESIVAIAEGGDAPLSIVADTNTPIPGGTGNFNGFTSIISSVLGINSSVIDKNNVAFQGFGASEQDGIYISRNGTLEVVVDLNTPIPGGTGNFSNFNNLMADENNAAFIGYLMFQKQGIYISRDGSLQVVADKNTPIPGGTGNFDNFNDNLLLNNNNVVFVGVDASQRRGIYISKDGNLQVVADYNTPIPGGTGNFSGFTLFSLDKNNNLVFQGGALGQQGFYISRNGSLQVLVDNNTTVRGSTIKFNDFLNPVVDGENVAFVRSFNNAALGIYAKIGDSLLKVADLSSRVDGKRIYSLGLFDKLVLKGNSLAFTATFADGTYGIVRADLITDKSPKSVPE